MKKTDNKIIRYKPNSITGLNSKQVQERIDNDLTNKRTEHNNSVLQIIFRNVFTFFNMMYLVIFVLLLIAEVEISNFFFVIIVLLNLFFALFQEIRAKIKIDKLRLLSEDLVTVIRSGNEKEISRDDIVLDDVIIYKQGSQIVADSIILDGEVMVNESQLTGESDVITKKRGDTVYCGSFVTGGRIIARVDKIKDDNEIAKLTSQVKTITKPNSQIFTSLNTILKVISIIIVPIGIIMFYLTYRSIDDASLDVFAKYQIAMRQTSGALLGMIPSGLYLLTTMSLSVGAMRLSQKQVLVNNVYSLEMLARCDVICLDKTGTITDGSMKVIKVEKIAKEDIDINRIITSMNYALNDNNYTSLALKDYFGSHRKIYANKILPFNSENKYSAVEFKDGSVYALGAPEFVILNHFDKYKSVIDNYTKQGYRVLALVKSSKLLEKNISKQTKLLGIIIIEDTIRDDAKEIVANFIENNVDVKIISGDNPYTVDVIAHKVGLNYDDKAISLENKTDEQVYQLAKTHHVFGRVKPHQKQIIVKSLKDDKKVVAMTGDGVNDILALKEANCSIAMASGSDAVKNVASIVLLDSKFSSMPIIINEGRRVANNIQQTSMLFLVKTTFIILLSLLFITGFMAKYGPENSYNAFPISPSQLTLIEIFAIGVPAFFLSLQPNFKKVEGHFTKNIFRRAFPGGLAVVFEVILTYFLSKLIGLNYKEVSTIIIIVATLTCMMILFLACRPFNRAKTILFVLMLSFSLFIMGASMFGLEKPINFQDQFKLYNLIKYKVDQIDIESSAKMDELIRDDNIDYFYQTIDEEGNIIKYSIDEYKTLDEETQKELVQMKYSYWRFDLKIPSNISDINNSGGLKIIFGNGLLNDSNETNLVFDENNLYLGNNTWTKYSGSNEYKDPLKIESEQLDNTYTIYYRNELNWNHVYCYIYYRTQSNVIDATSLLLAIALSEASYVILATIIFIIDFITDKRTRLKLLRKNQEREETTDEYKEKEKL